MELELINCTQVLLDEISRKYFCQKDIALTYKLAMMSRYETDWKQVNQAIIERFGLKGLLRIKNKAHKGLKK